MSKRGRPQRPRTRVPAVETVRSMWIAWALAWVLLMLIYSERGDFSVLCRDQETHAYFPEGYLEATNFRVLLPIYGHAKSECSATTREFEEITPSAWSGTEIFDEDATQGLCLTNDLEHPEVRTAMSTVFLHSEDIHVGCVREPLWLHASVRVCACTKITQAKSTVKNLVLWSLPCLLDVPTGYIQSSRRCLGPAISYPVGHRT
ncbi:hypothetical protein EVAR_35588_1 [Eumeta japonica]|uniref:Uncharacterized protein n=1 Tax=Eumeta variegata TaxID=151549 RepID=A0A4C1XPU0_EUMVA|nr:hypothetical protein EVAR_35588_1 [Eumeta japonica]